jgi:hypothetical protein
MLVLNRARGSEGQLDNRCIILALIHRKVLFWQCFGGAPET